MNPALLSWKGNLARDLIDVIKKEIRDHENAIETLKDMLRKASRIGSSGTPPGVLTAEGNLIRKPTATAKVADSIEMLLEYGKKTMKRGELIKALADQNLVGGKDEDQRFQSASEAIRRGLIVSPPHKTGYLKEDPDTTIHWVSGVRKSRVGKKVLR
jgi:hypothetical protein